MSKFLQDIYDIRVKPDVPRGPVTRRRCEWQGCQETAPYRAPKSRDRMRDFHWFCLDHVRQYNAGWNFFAGMSQPEIERYIHNNVAGQRPTWKMGDGERGQAWRGFRYDPLGLLDDGPVGFRGHAQAAKPWKPRLPAATLRALEVLQLDDEATLEDIKGRYKELVKRYHPDTNGGERDSEERLRSVIQAYTHLKSCARLGRWPAP